MDDVSKKNLVVRKMLDQREDVVEVRCVEAPEGVLLLVDRDSVVDDFEDNVLGGDGPLFLVVISSVQM